MSLFFFVLVQVETLVQEMVPNNTVSIRGRDLVYFLVYTCVKGVFIWEVELCMILI